MEKIPEVQTMGASLSGTTVRTPTLIGVLTSKVHPTDGEESFAGPRGPDTFYNGQRSSGNFQVVGL